MTRALPAGEPGETHDLGTIVLPGLTTVSGRVIDVEGKPVPKAIVVCRGVADRTVGGALTDETGAFTLRVPATGLFRVEAQKGGMQAATAEADADSAPVELRMVDPR